MAVSDKLKLNGDKCLCQITVGSSTIDFDIAADSSPLLAHGAHTVNKWTSQNIKAQGFVKDGVYESTTLTVTFHKTEFDTIEDAWKNGSKGTYTVTQSAGTGATGEMTFTKTYTDCIFRASSTPTVTPGKLDYVTFQLEITCLANVSGT